jgi:peptidoglycan/LPS O-acetylase OafA/YrhL
MSTVADGAIKERSLYDDRVAVAGQFLSVQVLRGIAAILVVIYHCYFLMTERLGAGSGYIERAVGSFGVDLFFVISGFIMVVSSRNLATRADGWRVFLSRRFLRIVPLFWIVLTVKIIGTFASPAVLIHARPGIVNIVCSYLFLPSKDATGEIRFVLDVGWTLTFEMLFYLLFALALALRVHVLKVLVPALTALAAIGLFRTDGWPAISFLANALPLEFVFGVLIGLATLRGERVSPTTGVTLILVGFVALFVLPLGLGLTGDPGATTMRVLAWGVPAAMIMLGLVSVETYSQPLLPRWALAIGDASYSIYLSHTFTLAALGMLAIRLGLTRWMSLSVVVVSGILASSLVGYCCFRLVERPLTERLKRSVPR